MNRKNFLKQCGWGCLGVAGMATTMPACTPKMYAGKIMGDELVVPLKDFETRAGKETHFKKYIVVQHELLQHPICVYRFNENTYSALWMQCTHQGAELQVFGDMLQCPAHGSEFTSAGVVRNGPADQSLRSFPITIATGHLRISLKAI